jgi:hypothetical protein
VHERINVESKTILMNNYFTQYLLQISHFTRLAVKLRIAVVTVMAGMVADGD